MVSRFWMPGCVVCMVAARVCLADDGATTAPKLTLDTTPTNAATADGLLMRELDRLNVAKPLRDLRLNIYGWVEAGYTFNLRHRGGEGSLSARDFNRVGPFNEEMGNHLQLNQVVLRFEREVEAKSWDIGGRVELLEGTDTAALRTNGMEIQTPGDNPGEVPQFDVTQAYVDLNVPLGNGLKVRIGKYENLMGYERVDPRQNAFYTHSLFFDSISYAPQTGIELFYSINDQWKVAGGITRGEWQSTEDDNTAISGNGQVVYTANKQLSIAMNVEVGPQTANSTDLYDSTFNPIVTWQATEKLKLAAEALYRYSSVEDINLPPFLIVDHAHGETYGVAAYAAYTINDFVTANLRADWAHADFIEDISLNTYSFTAGAAIRPMPKDPVGKNLVIRPELRYLCSEDLIFMAGRPEFGQNYQPFRDQWLVAMDVIFTF